MATKPQGGGGGLSLATGLDVVFGEEASAAVEDPLTPAVVMAMHQVDDVTLSERQVVGFGGLVVVQRHHWTHRRSAVTVWVLWISAGGLVQY